MLPQGAKEYNIENAFSKGLVQDKGIHVLPINYSPKMKNIRIVNKTTTVRKGRRTIADYHYVGDTFVQALGFNKYLYYTYFDGTNTKLKLSNYTNIVDGIVANNDRGNIGGATAVPSFLMYGKYVMVFTGIDYPYYIDNTADGGPGVAHTRTQMAVANIEAGANPRFGDVFIQATYVAGGGANSNVLYISRGITKTNPEYSFDWINTGSQKIYMQANIVSVKATLDRLFIFTEKSVEYIDRGSTTSVSGIVTTFSTAIAGENTPFNNNCVVIADDRVFFLTKGKQIKTLNFLPGVTETQVGDLSNRPEQSIQGFLDSLADDQSTAFGIFDKNEKNVYFYLKSKGSNVNDTTLIYDIINDTFLIDTNKFYSCGCIVDQNRIFTGSSLGLYLQEDNYGNTDNGANIQWERWTTDFTLGKPNLRKKRREIDVVGEINYLGAINVDVYADSRKILGPYTIDYAKAGGGVGLGGIGSFPIGSVPIGGETGEDKTIPFELTVSKGELRYKSNRLTLRFYGESIGGSFALSDLTLYAMVLGSKEIRNKLYMQTQKDIFIQQEDGSYILREDGSRILFE